MNESLVSKEISELSVLLVMPDGVSIYTNADGTYIRFTSNLDVCNDGSGPAYGDPHHQSQTAYYNGGKYLNADVDKYIVTPPQVRKMVPPIVMGCMGRVTNLQTDVNHEGVIGDVGPDDKTGECAYCLAKIVNPNIDHNHGDLTHNYLYEFWPGIPAVVDGKKYKLEAAG
jgi:hypothetical protein